MAVSIKQCGCLSHVLIGCRLDDLQTNTATKLSPDYACSKQHFC
jgi:hypothetical protein